MGCNTFQLESSFSFSVHLWMGQHFVKACSHVTYACVFSSIVKKGFLGSKWWYSYLIKFSRMGRRRSKENSNADVTCDITFKLMFYGLKCWILCCKLKDLFQCCLICFEHLQKPSFWTIPVSSILPRWHLWIVNNVLGKMETNSENTESRSISVLGQKIYFL